LASPEGAWWELGFKPWVNPKTITTAVAVCNICHWSGDEFIGPYHTEMATCPRCGSVARDRFLLFCFLSRRGYVKNLRVLETSPRMGAGYRSMMRRYFKYTASDYDLSAHEGDIQIDLQAMALPDSSIDILLTPHVLEHVPDTEKALSEIYRVLAPGGRMYLQVPLCYGSTQVPSTPEFHADNTPVFFNFGWDLTDKLRAAGFTTTVLVTQDYFEMLNQSVAAPVSNGDGFNVEELVTAARPQDLTPVTDSQVSRVFGFLPAYHYATWECIKPN
jgi:SAM-dependent methyltransferase